MYKLFGCVICSSFGFERIFGEAVSQGKGGNEVFHSQNCCP